MDIVLKIASFIFVTTFAPNVTDRALKEKGGKNPKLILSNSKLNDIYGLSYTIVAQ